MRWQRATSCVVVLATTMLLSACYRSHQRPRMRSDLNNDGRDDILTITGDPDATVFAAMSDGTRFGPDAVWNQFNPPGPYNQLGTPHLGDVNGDGTFDLIAFAAADVFVAVSDGTRFGDATRWAEDAPVTGSSDERTGVGDFNGDGKDDAFILAPDATVKVALSDGARFGGWLSWGRALPDPPYRANHNAPPRVGDVNGDHKDDLVIFMYEPSYDVYVALSTGDRFMIGARWHDSFNPGQGWYVPSTSTPTTYTPYLPSTGVGDFNGDGKDDIVAFTRHVDSDVFVALSDGSRFSPTVSKWHDFFANETEIPGVGDFNGDGKDDIVCFKPGANADVFVALSDGHEFNGTGQRWHDSFGDDRSWPEPEWPLPGLVDLNIAN